MVAGLEEPTSGAVRFDDEDVTEVHAKERPVAMVFQNYALYPHKTVLENMAFGLKMSTDMTAEQRRERVTEMAEMMGIEDLLDDKPDELSGGQKQRVALGRAIAREPEVFLFDEPLSNLDAKLRTEMRAEIQKLQKEFGVTAMYVTHDQEEAMTMGDRLAILNDGKLQQVGKPTEVYENPVNKFVAGFIGSPSMNFIDVDVETDGSSATIHDDASGLAFELSDEYVAGHELENAPTRSESGPRTFGSWRIRPATRRSPRPSRSSSRSAPTTTSTSRSTRTFSRARPRTSCPRPATRWAWCSRKRTFTCSTRRPAKTCS